MANSKSIVLLLVIIILGLIAFFYFRKVQTNSSQNSEIEVEEMDVEEEVDDIDREGLEEEVLNRSEIEMKTFTEYTIQEQLKPSKLKGISDEQINDHWNLYKGYVAQVNKLRGELAQLRLDGKIDSLEYADRRRRYGFEYNGMVLHEYYFGNLGSKKTKLESMELQQELEKTWGSYDFWVSDFTNAGKTRGIGWAILCLDPTTNQLINIFVAEHQDGNIAGFMPILVMDVWEHAYMVDHEAGGRGDYIKAFLQNINWEVVEKRFADAIAGKITKRF